jgi:hypothetical protein
VWVIGLEFVRRIGMELKIIGFELEFELEARLGLCWSRMVRLR